MAGECFFRVPFAVEGDISEIPQPLQTGGDVSMQSGFTFDYERDPSSDPSAKDVPRQETNWLYYVVTAALRQYQTEGAFPYITAEMNGGAAFPYVTGARCRYESAVYESLVDNNTSPPTDTDKWRNASKASDDGVLSGLVLPFSGTLGGTDNKHPVNRKTDDADLSYALCDGGTYTAPDGTEVVTPDLRGRFVIGESESFISGSAGGSVSHSHGNVGATTLTVAQIPSHNHTIYMTGYNVLATGGGWVAPASSGVAATTVGATGGSGSHTHSTSAATALPPYYALCYIMKL